MDELAWLSLAICQLQMMSWFEVLRNCRANSSLGVIPRLVLMSFYDLLVDHESSNVNIVATAHETESNLATLSSRVVITITRASLPLRKILLSRMRMGLDQPKIQSGQSEKTGFWFIYFNFGSNRAELFWIFL